MRRDQEGLRVGRSKEKQAESCQELDRALCFGGEVNAKYIWKAVSLAVALIDSAPRTELTSHQIYFALL